MTRKNPGFFRVIRVQCCAMNSSFTEEIANSISHGLGLLLAITAVPVLVLAAMKVGSAHFLIGVSVFGGTMVLLYLASTLYHSLTHEAAKRLFRLFDHAAIFLLIAGPYTPLSRGVLRVPWGWSMLAAVWTKSQNSLFAASRVRE